MPAVIVPPRAGVLSAAGIMTAPRQVDLVRSWAEPADHAGAGRAVEQLAKHAVSHLGVGAVVDTFMDCRYAGQSHELTVAGVSAFESEHRRRNGFTRAESAIEVVALRAVARLQSLVRLADLPDPGDRRGPVKGPAVVAEADCTLWVAAGWTAAVNEAGAWILTR
jgi:5-oxoprolinase (ATP-hydrolysing)